MQIFDAHLDAFYRGTITVAKVSALGAISLNSTAVVTYRYNSSAIRFHLVLSALILTPLEAQ